MKISSIREKVIKKIFVGYIELVYKTSYVEFDVEELKTKTLKDSIVGFWHGDSYAMNLLLKKILKDNVNPRVVVTADKRGDFIENTIKRYGGKALRMPNGVKMKSFLTTLREASKERNSTLCIALDGPQGPIYEAKKIGFRLAADGDKPLIGITVSFSRKVTITKRWDNYVIPIPFTKIKFKAIYFGQINREFLASFKENKEFIKNKLKVI